MRDVLIIGAGPAGATAARFAAKAGLSVLLLDQSSKGRIGDKTCGNAIGVGVFKEVDINPPKSAYCGLVDGIEVISPDWKMVYRLEQQGEKGMILDRLGFGQYLLQLALDAGAELTDNFAVTGPILDGGVVGIRGVNQKTKSREEHRAKVVVDASGVGAVIRRNLGDLVDNSTDNDETMVCHRQIRRVAEPTTKYSRIYLDQDAAPGGYFWYFPMGDEMVNTGLGVAKGTTSPESAFEAYARKLPELAESKLIHAGSAIVATRRPMSPSVHDGVIFTGDAGFTVDPLHGGGIASSMQAGKIVAETLTEAVEKGDYSARTLWSYCREFNTTVGRIHASHDVLRIFLQGLYNEEANFGMANGVITERDVMDMSSGKPLNLGLTEGIRRLLTGAGKAPLLTKLLRLPGLLKEVEGLYSSFPSGPGPEFQAWKEKDLTVHKRAHEQVGGTALARAMASAKGS